jgi:hypothetical protein
VRPDKVILTWREMNLRAVVSQNFAEAAARHWQNLADKQKHLSDVEFVNQNARGK